jgi:hypothetical protein
MGAARDRGGCDLQNNQWASNKALSSFGGPNNEEYPLGRAAIAGRIPWVAICSRAANSSHWRFQAGKWRSDLRLRDRLSHLRDAEFEQIQRRVVSHDPVCRGASNLTITPCLLNNLSRSEVTAVKTLSAIAPGAGVSELRSDQPVWNFPFFMIERVRFLKYQRPSILT